MIESAFVPIRSAYAAFATLRSPIVTLNAIGEASEMCLRLLASAQRRHQGDTKGKKNYEVFQNGDKLTRSVSTLLFIEDPVRFRSCWERALQASALDRVASFSLWNETLYTAAASFACAYDLCLPGSRKTPGTYLEILVPSQMARW